MSRIDPKLPEAHIYLPEVIKSPINALSEIIRNGVYRVELFRIDPKLPEAYLKLTVISEVTFLSPEVQSTHFG